MSTKVTEYEMINIYVGQTNLSKEIKFNFNDEFTIAWNEPLYLYKYTKSQRKCSKAHHWSAYRFHPTFFSNIS